MAEMDTKQDRSKVFRPVGKYTVNMRDVLGLGGYGAVFPAVNEKRNKVAAKRIDTAGKESLQTILKDFDKLRSCKHPNVISIFDYLQEGTFIWTFMELCPDGDLKSFCLKHDLNMQQHLQIMSQIMKGIEYLHSKNIIHRDIKPANVLVANKSTLYVKLTDFDISKFLDETDETSAMESNVGTSYFKAVEFFRRNQHGKLHYHRNVDIFAAGLTFLAMIQKNKGLVPRIETPKSPSEVNDAIGALLAERIKYNLTPLDVVVIKESSSSTERGLTKEVKKLIRKMTSIYPEDRPSAVKVCQDLAQIRNVLELDTYTVHANQEETQTKVYAAYDGKQNKVLAKKIDTKEMSEGCRDRLYRALKELPKLNHPNLIRIYDAIRAKDAIWVFEEQYKLKSLKEFLQGSPGSPVPLKVRIEVTEQIVKGCEHLDRHHAIYAGRNLRSIFVDDDQNPLVKQQPFSVDKFLESEREMNLMLTDPEEASLRPPEYFFYGQAATVYRLGLMFLDIMQPKMDSADVVRFNEKVLVSDVNMSVGQRTATRMQSVTLAEVKHSLHGASIFRFEDLIKEKFSEMIHKMTSLWPEHRPSFQQILRLLEEMKDCFIQIPNIKLRKLHTWETTMCRNQSSAVRFKNQLIMKTGTHFTAFSVRKCEKRNTSISAKCSHSWWNVCCLCEHPGDKDCILECCSECRQITSYNLVSGEAKVVCGDVSMNTICTGPGETIYGFESRKGILQLEWRNELKLFKVVRTFELAVRFAFSRLCYVDRFGLILATHHNDQRTDILAINVTDNVVVWRRMTIEPNVLSGLCSDDTGRVYIILDNRHYIVTLIIMDGRTGEKLDEFPLSLYEVHNNYRHDLFCSGSELTCFSSWVGIPDYRYKLTCFEITEGIDNEEVNDDAD